MSLADLHTYAHILVGGDVRRADVGQLKHWLPRADVQAVVQGKRLDTPLIVTGEEISCGLAMRLNRYACARIRDAGFQDLVNTWQISV